MKIAIRKYLDAAMVVTFFVVAVGVYFMFAFLADALGWSVGWVGDFFEMVGDVFAGLWGWFRG